MYDTLPCVCHLHITPVWSRQPSHMHIHMHTLVYIHLHIQYYSICSLSIIMQLSQLPLVMILLCHASLINHHQSVSSSFTYLYLCVFHPKLVYHSLLNCYCACILPYRCQSWAYHQYHSMTIIIISLAMSFIIMCCCIIIHHDDGDAHVLHVSVIIVFGWCSCAFLRRYIYPRVLLHLVACLVHMHHTYHSITTWHFHIIMRPPCLHPY